jgi:hypothetical protein
MLMKSKEGVLRRRKYRTTLSNGNVENARFRWFWLNEELTVLGVMNAIDCCRNDAEGAYVWARRAHRSDEAFHTGWAGGQRK